MSRGPLPETGRVISAVTAPAGVMRLILSVLNSVNQRLPSEARGMLRGPLAGGGMGNSIAVTAGTQRSSSCCSMGRKERGRDFLTGLDHRKNWRSERRNRFMWRLKVKE